MRGDGLGAIDFGLFLQALGGKFERPGEHQRRNQANGQHDDHDSGRRVVKAEQGENGLGDLNQQPGDHHVGGAYAQDITSFQLPE